MTSPATTDKKDRPATPTEDYNNPRTASWVNAQSPPQASPIQESDLNFYPPHTDLRDKTRVPESSTMRGRQLLDKEIPEDSYQAGDADLIIPEREFETSKPRRDGYGNRLPRSRSSTPQRMK